jgi:cell division protein FtsQ
MQDYRVRRAKPRRFTLRRKSRKPSPATRLAIQAGLTPALPQRRAPRHRLRTVLRRVAAWLRPGRIPASVWFVVGMLWLGGGMTWGALRAWEVPISSLDFTGQEKLTPVQIAAAAALYPGLPLGGLDPLTLAERLLAHPRIARADVRRTAPGRLDIRIAERRPAALAQLGDGQAAVLDAEGMVLERIDESQWSGSPLPRLRGGGAEVQPGRRAGEGPLRRGLEFAALARAVPGLEEEPFTVDARNHFVVRLLLDARGRTLILPWRGAGDALRAYLRAEPALLAAAPGFRVADVRALPRDGAARIALSR